MLHINIYPETSGENIYMDVGLRLRPRQGSQEKNIGQLIMPIIAGQLFLQQIGKINTGQGGIAFHVEKAAG